MKNPTRILLTGGTGFIGSEIIRQGLAAGYHVAALVRDVRKLPRDGLLTPIAGDLSQPDWKAIEKFKPTVCLHCAWIAAPGIYQNSPANEDYRNWSIRLAERLYEAGLEKFIGMGTCLEYASSPLALAENCPRPKSPCSYGQAKLAVLDALEALAPSPNAWAWMRVFYAYGLGEHPQQFISSAIRILSQGKSLTLLKPADVVDYIHVKDVAAAVLAGLDPAASGVFNVGSGQNRTVAQIGQIIAKMCRAEDKLVFNDQVQSSARFASIRRLENYNWKPKWDFKRSVEEMASSV